MIKKLLVLMLIIGMSSMANALVLSFELAGGGTDVEEFSAVTINIRGDVGADDYKVTTAITGSFSGVGVGTVDTGFTDSLTTNGQLKDGTVSNIWVYEKKGIVDTVGEDPSVLSSVVFGTITLTSGADGGTITIDDFAGSAYGPPTSSKYNNTTVTMGSLVLDIVPEPMTIALLGLGGLFLRRRK